MRLSLRVENFVYIALCDLEMCSYRDDEKMPAEYQGIIYSENNHTDTEYRLW
jgi:hypothetical protein